MRCSRFFLLWEDENILLEEIMPDKYLKFHFLEDCIFLS